MLILAIDPGDEESGFVVYGTKSKKVKSKGIIKNVNLAALIVKRDESICANRLAIEIIISYGQKIGMHTINTAKWVGRFEQAWDTAFKTDFHEIKRPEVKSHLCYSAQASDSGVRFALLERYGGKELAIGRSKKPGPLYGLKSHMWSALAIAITSAEKRK